ncbi:PH domain-containing protein [Dactylosporangium aurantiacum]|uniref:PH domain-containing protein n=1 Tax=Dactylosporangium aurantiacum TaxID=35754 RepID=A0A9Q9ILY3_9ACTN|nr:PH domain-containing protein [Dactylosporangium aurantiacum]MDG6109342.1 PH domain-containing protein [Dactylosporangium aurantiacum]UWZ56450.1 PH domain-containing protein [Dactylosporangium aurantiacum]
MTAPPETVVWRSISPRYFWLRLAVLAAWTLAFAVAAVVAAVLVSGWFLLLVFAALVLGALRAVFVRRSVRAWGYAERAEDLLVRHGLLVRRLSIVPYARMQFVDVTAGPLERAAGLATVTLHTAAAASDASVPGLEAAEATRLRDRLAALGEIREEGL